MTPASPRRCATACWPGCGPPARAPRSCCGPRRCSDRRSRRPPSPGCSASRRRRRRCAANGCLETRLTRVAGRAYEFANDLVQEVLYDSTPQPTRLAHHLRAADVLADNPEAVARHAQAAGDDRRAAPGLAGRRAARRPPIRRRRRRGAARQRDRGGRPVRADAELRTSALLLRARVRETMFRFDDALTDAAAALRAQSGDRRPPRRDGRAAGAGWAGLGRGRAAGRGRHRAHAGGAGPRGTAG